MAGSSDEDSDDFPARDEKDDVDGRSSEDGGFSDYLEDGNETGSDSDSGEEPATNGFIKSDQPPPSEWTEFNLKVISMRPIFKRARVQFANKLAKQIKALRQRKGNESQVEKNRRKAERLVDEISYVNRLKKDIIAKFALLHSKEEIAKILNDGESSMEYRVKAKVAAMPMIASAADDYHQKHLDWRETLFKLIQLAGHTKKRKRRRMHGKGKNPKKKNADKKKPSGLKADDDGTGRFDASNFPEPPPGLENLIADADSSEPDSSGDENEWSPSNVRSGPQRPMPRSNVRSSKEESEFEESSSLRKTSVVAKTHDAVSDFAEAPLPKKGESNKMPEPQPESAVETISQKRKVDDVEVSQSKKSKTSPFQNNVGINQKTKGIAKMLDGEHSESDNEETSDSEKPRGVNVDPFFMTSDNKEYKTIWKVEPADSFKNKDRDRKKEPVFVFKNLRPYEDVISGKPSKRPVEPNNRKAKKPKEKPGQSAVDTEKLHPSWQAKKKQNLTAVPFQGKKIVFDDD